MNKDRLIHDVKQLSYAFPVSINEGYTKIIVAEFKLPPGYNEHKTRILLEIPKKYPLTPPGVGSSHVYVPSHLRYKGRVPTDFHKHSGPKNWAWWCYEKIKWDSSKDNLITFFELMRIFMSNPPTRSFL